MPQGAWTLLRSNVGQNDTPDLTNNRFAAVWTDAGLFIQHQVDIGAWENRGIGSMDWDYQNLNLYLDPNADQEPIAALSPDGYQIAFNQPLGESEISPDEVSAGFFTEAHVNSTFGNQGGAYSNFANMVMRQTTRQSPAFGYTEVFIPWSDFDATDPSKGFDPAIDDVGLYHPEAPFDGEQWYFNIARIETGEFTFNASGLKSGVYFYAISTKNFTSIRKMILLK